jgi:predicted ATPase/DNA-binding winged helix-turn-helix (wHTH) protein
MQGALVMMRVGNIDVSIETRQVYVDGKPVVLGGRATDILILLVQANSALVTKDEIMQTVWPDTVVEENNIHVHISAIRRLLGPYRHCLVSVSGRGYQLKGEARSAHADDNAGAEPMQTGKYRLPFIHTPLFGREKALLEVHSQLARASVVTLIGAGGIGKTRLAIEVARSAYIGRPGDVRYIELGHLTEPGAVVAAVGDAMGPPPEQREWRREDGAPDTSPTLVLLDNCEHLVHGLASVVDPLLDADPSVRILATSREPLRATHECLYRVEPLAVPARDGSDTTSATSSSVRMFLHHARLIDSSFASGDGAVRLIGRLCRRLDGMPLAIEIAAARAAVLGIEAVLDEIDERFNNLSGGHRYGLPRHQTLRATFDWSYNRLNSIEQSVFRRLGTIDGTFTIADACAAAMGKDMTVEQITDAIWSLATKSLLVSDVRHSRSLYRLLEPARSYALQKLGDNGEMTAIAPRRRETPDRRLPTARTTLYSTGRHPLLEANGDYSGQRHAGAPQMKTEVHAATACTVSNVLLAPSTETAPLTPATPALESSPSPSSATP